MKKIILLSTLTFISVFGIVSASSDFTPDTFSTCISNTDRNSSEFQDEYFVFNCLAKAFK